MKLAEQRLIGDEHADGEVALAVITFMPPSTSTAAVDAVCTNGGTAAPTCAEHAELLRVLIVLA